MNFILSSKNEHSIFEMAQTGLYLTAETIERLLKLYDKGATGKYKIAAAALKKDFAEYLNSHLSHVKGNGLEKSFQTLIDADIPKLVRNIGFNAQDNPQRIQQEYLDAIAFILREEKENITSDKPPKKRKKELSIQQNSKIKKRAKASKNEDRVQYDEIIESALNANHKTHRPEDLLIILIEKMSNQRISELTIVAEDLSFVFKLAPTIIDFLSRPKARICLLYAPKNGEALLYNPEFLLLYKLGIEIELLYFHESFSANGFYFNYFAPDESEISLAIDFYSIRGNIFERTSLLEIYSLASSVNGSELRSAIADIQWKRKRTFRLIKHKEFHSRRMTTDEYTSWLEIRFDKCKTFTDTIPAYSAMLASKHDVKFYFKTIDFNKIYHRMKGITAYKAYQAEKTIIGNSLYSEIEGDTIEFHPVNIFENEKGLDYYAANVPILEKRSNNCYEIAEGTCRLYIASLNPKIKKVRTLIIENLPELAFELKAGYANYVSNDWDDLAIYEEHPNKDEITILKHERNIEKYVTHPFGKGIYKELTQLLTDGKFITPDQAVLFNPKKV